MICRWRWRQGNARYPFRTRKLSLPALMVLHPGGCGRVSYRRHLNKQKLHTIKTRQDTHVLTGLFGIPTWSISSRPYENPAGIQHRPTTPYRRYRNISPRRTGVSSYRIGCFHSCPRKYVLGRCGVIKATTPTLVLRALP